MKKIGFLLIALGVLSAFLAFNMDVTVGQTYNIGLLNERQNIVYLSGVLFLAGIILFGFSVVNNDGSTDKKLIRRALFSQLGMIEQKKESEVDAFIDNKNGTITDKITGLTWQSFSVGQTWDGISCIGKPLKMSWNDAMKLTSDYAGYDDWRLPTKEELMTLVLYFNVNKDDSLIVSNKSNFTLMSTTQSNWYWSSTLYADDIEFAWYFDFDYSNYNSSLKRDNFFVRLVR